MIFGNNFRLIVALRHLTRLEPIPQANVHVHSPRFLDRFADLLDLALAHRRRAVAGAHRVEELPVVQAQALVQSAVARDADDLVRTRRPGDVIAPLAVRALEAQVDLHVVVQRDLEVHLLLPVRALGLDHALGADAAACRIVVGAGAAAACAIVNVPPYGKKIS